MIPTGNSKHRPAADIVAKIQNDAAQVKQVCLQLRNTQTVTVAACLNAYAVINSALSYMAQYAGDQRIIDFANAEAAKDPYFPTGYNVSDDYAVYAATCNNILSALRNSIIPTDANDNIVEKYFDTNGVIQNVTVDRTTLDALNTDIDKLLTVLD